MFKYSRCSDFGAAAFLLEVREFLTEEKRFACAGVGDFWWLLLLGIEVVVCFGGSLPAPGPEDTATGTLPTSIGAIREDHSDISNTSLVVSDKSPTTIWVRSAWALTRW